MKNVLVIEKSLSHTVSSDMRAILDLEVIHRRESGFSISANRLDGKTGSIDESNLARLLCDCAQPKLENKQDISPMEQSLRLIANIFQNDFRFRALCQVDDNARAALSAIGAKLPPPMLEK